LKQPLSALVVVHTSDLRVLLLERADAPGFWQSVTGSAERGEAPADTAARELREETGIDASAHGGVTDWRIANRYEIFTQWRHRYAEGTTHNVESVFSVRVDPAVDVRIAPREHLRYAWLPWRDAAAQCFSWSNRDAILMLPHRESRESR
jgi:dihydroneopterin triphosphate diphosphatase